VEGSRGYSGPSFNGYRGSASSIFGGRDNVVSGGGESDWGRGEGNSQMNAEKGHWKKRRMLMAKNIFKRKHEAQPWLGEKQAAILLKKGGGWRIWGFA